MVEQCLAQRSHEDRVNAAGASKVHQGGTTVVAHDVEIPQVVKEIGVSEYPKNALGFAAMVSAFKNGKTVI